MNDEQTNLPVPVEEKKTKLSAREFVTHIFQPLKGKDLGQAVEDFSSEMTLVIEGMSEDLETVSRETEKLSAQQTILEENVLDQVYTLREETEKLGKELKAQSKRLEKLEKAVADKKITKVAGFTRMLRQATWLAAVIAGSWIIITLIKTFIK